MKLAVNSRIYTATKTGIQRYIENTYQEILKNHPEVDVVFFQTNTSKTLGKTLVIPPFLGLLGVTLFDFILVLFLIMKERPDVYHGPSHVLPLIKIPGVKYALTVHDCAPFIVPKSYSLLYRTYFKITLWVSVKKADVIFAVSENTKKDIVRLFNIPESKIVVTYCGFDSISKESLIQTTDRVHPFFMAAVTHPKRKNIRGALEAFALFKEKYPNKLVEFICVGSIGQAEQAQLKELCVTLGIDSQCHFLGFVDDVTLRSLYVSTLALVYPSFYEGFGMPPLEIMSLGGIALVSDVSSLPEVVPFPEFRFDPNSQSSIAQRMDFIYSLTQKERTLCISKTQSHALSFTWEKSTDFFLKGLL